MRSVRAGVETQKKPAPMMDGKTLWLTVDNILDVERHAVEGISGIGEQMRLDSAAIDRNVGCWQQHWIFHKSEHQRI